MTAWIGLDGRYLDAHHPGIGRYVFELATALPAALTDLRLALLHRGEEAGAGRFDLASLARGGVTLVPDGGAPRSLVAPWRLRRQTREPALDLWHAPYFPTSFGPACPRVVTVYDTIAFEPRFYPAASKRLLLRLLLRLAVRRAHRVLTLSHAAKEDMLRYGVEAERVVVTPAGVGAAFRPCPPPEIVALRDRLELPGRYVLFVGADQPHKNLSRLLEAWAILQTPFQRTEQAVTLVLAGFDRTGRTTVDRVPASSLARVRHLGPIRDDDLPALLSGAEVFVFPSLAEGFGLPVLEAMACGTPVACSTAGSLPEVAGQAALFFEPTSARSLARALATLLDDAGARQHLVEAGFERAATFTWRETARATAAVYRQVLGAA